MLFNGEAADLLTSCGYSTSHCGYCDRDDTSHTYGVWAHSLSVHTYQTLLDRGWRRSGHYLYRPNLRRSCCKLYTIKLDPTRFKLDKKHRQTLNKFNRYVLGHDWDDRVCAQRRNGAAEHEQRTEKGKEGEKEYLIVATSDRPHKSPVVDFSRTVHLSERVSIPAWLPTPAHNFRITNEPASFTPEKFSLYKKYQTLIHHDDPASVTESSFRRFLCDSPLHATASFGSRHVVYYIDDTPVAVAVLDYLPHSISSVYFAYDPAFGELGLGHLSALREIEESKRLGVGYYMGYYVPDCPKMRYKGSYKPSYLLDPATPVNNEREEGEAEKWIDLEKFKKSWSGMVKGAEGGEEEVAEKKKEVDWYCSFIDPQPSMSPTDPVTRLCHSDMPGLSRRFQKSKAATLANESEHEKEAEEEGEEGELEDGWVLEEGGVTTISRSMAWHSKATENERVRRELGQVMGFDLLRHAIVTIE